MNKLELTGRARTYIQQLKEPRFAALPQVAEAFFKTKTVVQKDGILLAPFSSFCNFKTLVCIWNKKFCGEKALFDSPSLPKEYHNLTKNEIIQSKFTLLIYFLS